MPVELSNFDRGSPVKSVEQQCTTKCDERKQVEDDENRGERLEQTCYAPNRSPALGSGFRAGYILKFRSLGGDRQAIQPACNRLGCPGGI